MAKIKLCINDEDLVSAERYEIANPVLHKLQNTTGTLWRLCDDGLAMEVMSPFRATLLPLHALNAWHAESENGRSVPCEIELELYHLQLNGGETDDNDNKTEPPKVLAGNEGLDYETIQNALLQVLEYNEWSSWRAVCPHIFIERVEPFRTIVLNTDALGRAQEWLQSLTQPMRFPHKSMRDRSTPGTEERLRLPAKLYAPLTKEPVQEITINFPPRTF